ncbi:ABC transporter permease [Candidatus Saccharibacteria bacterium]|nr:ABC transporter permease [Candidatus Saccharibacteria bacterium]
MTLLLNSNARMALQSIRSNKLRSLLTMVGIIIGVSSVILTISLGEGIRRQVADTNQTSNDSLVTVRSGQIVKRSADGVITDVNYLASLGVNTLTYQDYEAIGKLPNAGTVVPLSTVSGLATNFEGESYPEATVVATTAKLPEIINQKVVYGGFFQDSTSSRRVAIIGKRVAEELFNENVPLGKLLTIRGHDFVVGGIFDEFKTNPLSAVTDFNKAIFISYTTAQSITSANPPIFQLLITPKDDVSAEQIAEATTALLLKNHGNQQDFTVLKGNETAIVARNTVAIATSFVAGIAAISLLVGGIGIMNIMFVNVTERTREIGVRKSLGATNRQIYHQFLIEAAVISTVGGIVGIIVALAGNALLRITTDLQPAVTWQIVALAVGVSAIVGIIFGTIPAVKAARKDPIESLRYE